jgi:hypothetical protein
MSKTKEEIDQDVVNSVINFLKEHSHNEVVTGFVDGQGTFFPINDIGQIDRSIESPAETPHS